MSASPPTPPPDSPAARAAAQVPWPAVNAYLFPGKDVPPEVLVGGFHRCCRQFIAACRAQEDASFYRTGPAEYEARFVPPLNVDHLSVTCSVANTEQPQSYLRERERALVGLTPHVRPPFFVQAEFVEGLNEDAQDIDCIKFHMRERTISGEKPASRDFAWHWRFGCACPGVEDYVRRLAEIQMKDKGAGGEAV